MKKVKIKDINHYQSQSINPAKMPDEIFEVYSVPSFDGKQPEYLSGSEIGSTKVLVQTNDVLLCKINPRINRVWVVGEPCEYTSIASSEWIIVRTNDVLPEYLAWYFRTQKFQKLMQSEVTGIGGSLTRAQPKRVAEYEVPICSIDEQMHIISCLNKVSQIVNVRKQQLATFDNLVKARFVEMFSCVEDERILEEIAEFVTVGIANSATHAYSEDGIVMFRNQNIKENYLDDSDVIYITPEFAERYGAKKLEANDILVTRTGYPGVACLVPSKYVGCQTFTTLIVRLKKTNALNPAYVCNYINSEYGKRYVEGEKVGVAQQNFGAKALAKMPIKIPSKELQNSFSAFSKQVDKSKVVVQRALDEAQKLFDSLMQEYFG